MFKKYFAILAYLFLTCTAIAATNVARIENFDKIKKNIIVRKYDHYNGDGRIFNEIKELDRQLNILRRSTERFVDIYVPERHPLVEKQLLRVGRIVELSDIKKVNDGLKEIRCLIYVESMDVYNDLTNILSKNILTRLRYDHEKYVKISGFIWDDREILKLSGIQECNLV